MTNPLIDSLVAVVAERPEDLPLRAHLAELLVVDGRGPEAVPHLGAVLAADPANEHAAALMRRALGMPGQPASTGGAPSTGAGGTDPGPSVSATPAIPRESSHGAPPAPSAPVGPADPGSSRFAPASSDGAPSGALAPSGGASTADPVPSDGVPSGAPAPSGGVPTVDPVPSDGVPSGAPASSGGVPTVDPVPSDGAPSEAPAPLEGGHDPVPEEGPTAPQGADHYPAGSAPGGPAPVDSTPTATEDSGQPVSGPAPEAPAPQGAREEESTPQGAREEAPADSGRPSRFDWDSAEEQVGGPAPAFVQGREAELNEGTDPGGEDMWDVEASTLTLADVGGMQAVKDRLNMAFLAPLRNPEMRRLYGKSLKGGLMLYGPPGCGKTYIARALAGEMGASFVSITLTDILDQFIGNSEANLHSLFETARAHAPVVLFLDEIDAIGQKRSQVSSSGWRGVTNQLLTEMDGIDSGNEGVFILAATNVPWDVDPALRRPGRFDRSVAVLPPDEPARQSILRHHLGSRPVEGIDLAHLARQTNGFTGADLAHLADSAVEYAMMDSMRTGTVRMVTMKDFKRALRQVRPSAGPWFSTARNIVAYGNRDGQYDDLAAYMRANKLL
ncbi:AAA family ATPase [Schaalia sp. HMT-877]|nr:AAA family ATPase [Schaalia sp. HMT-877]